jgi:arginine-tRNA-protein transferase
VHVDRPVATEEKFDLYRRYLLDWHGRSDNDFDDFNDFLYESPVDSLEFTYRDVNAKLIAVGICDVSPSSLSSVYFYFDPSEKHRSLGTFGVLHEIGWAANKCIPHYYLGYWVKACSAMSYKASFHPHEILGSDGVWREQAKI